jgi:hypothetical protein
MTDTALIEVPALEPGRTPFSWSAAIAGTFAAIAVTLLVIALGSGIGLSFASPYGSGPSATTLTVVAAVWLVMAQTMGFATGGYLAGRLRSPAFDGVPGETAFRDAAEGLMVWAIGAIALAALAGLTGLFAMGATAHVAAGAAAGRNDAAGTTAYTPADYFVDLMFRSNPREATAGGQTPSSSTNDMTTVGMASPRAPHPLDAETRAEVNRILARSVIQTRLDDNDRAYLAQLVAARAGLPPEEAQKRVQDVENKARDAADKTAKAGALFSFWTFMSLLFGGTAATLAGMLGGQLRDAEGRFAAAR